MRKYLILALIIGPASAHATGAMSCDSGDPAHWKSKEDMTQMLTSEGWEVRFMKEDGGCWEVYGTTPEGQRAEAYFDPVTGEKLLVSQRGKILYRKADD